MAGESTLGLVERWNRWRAYAYLSPFEAWLNRLLWTLLAVSLGFSLAQRVLLADVPAFSEWAFRAGDLLYDLAIAYIGSFVFYVLVVRLPLRRDRRNVYRRMAFKLRGPHDQAIELIRHLNRAAGLVNAPTRGFTRENIDELCAALTPSTTGTFFGENTRLNLNVLELISHEIGLIQRVNAEILALSTFLPSEAIDYVTAIEECTFLRYTPMIFPHAGALGTNMAWMADDFRTYLRLVNRFDRWRIEFAQVQRRLVELPDDDEGELLSRY